MFSISEFLTAIDIKRYHTCHRGCVVRIQESTAPKNLPGAAHSFNRQSKVQQDQQNHLGAYYWLMEKSEQVFTLSSHRAMSQPVAQVKLFCTVACFMVSEPGLKRFHTIQSPGFFSTLTLLQCFTGCAWYLFFFIERRSLQKQWWGQATMMQYGWFNCSWDSSL